MVAFGNIPRSVFPLNYGGSLQKKTQKGPNIEVSILC